MPFQYFPGCIARTRHDNYRRQCTARLDGLCNRPEPVVRHVKHHFPVGNVRRRPLNFARVITELVPITVVYIIQTPDLVLVQFHPSPVIVPEVSIKPLSVVLENVLENGSLD